MEAAVIVRTKNGYGTSHSHETYRAQGWSAGRNAARIDRWDDYETAVAVARERFRAEANRFAAFSYAFRTTMADNRKERKRRRKEKKAKQLNGGKK